MYRLSTQLPALPFMAGALASALILTGDNAWSVAAGIALLALAGLFSMHAPSRGLIFTAIGAVATAISAILLTPGLMILDNKEVVAVGTVESSVAGTKGIRAIVTVDNIDGEECSPTRIRLGISDQTKNIKEGDIISLRGILEPGDRMSEIPYMNISSQVNKADRVSATMFVRPEQLDIIGRDNSLWYRISHLRTAIAEKCYSSVLSPEASSLLVGACLGTGDTKVDVKERFRATGLAHLLCVSGFHVGIVGWLLALVLWPLKAWSRIGRLRYIMILAGVWFFVAITGAQPSAIRAATMITTFYLGGLLQRRSSPYNSLALAVGVMIAFNPFNLYSIGFQLSVSAIVGLLVFADRLNPFPISRRKPYGLFTLITVPLAALIGTAPAVLFWFHRLPILSVPVNAIATIIFPVFLIFGTVAVVFGISWAAMIADWLCNAILKICDTAISFDSNILSGIYLNTANLVVIIAVLALCGLVLNLSKTSHRLSVGGMATAIMLLVFLPSQKADAELIAAGNTIGNQIILRNGDKSHIISTRNSLPFDMSDYFNAHAVAPEQQTRVGEKAIEIDGFRIGYVGSQKGTDTACDLLLVDGKCKSDIREIIAGYSPTIVLIGANTSTARCMEIEKVCASHGISTHRLFSKAFRVGMSELKAKQVLARG